MLAMLFLLAVGAAVAFGSLFLIAAIMFRALLELILLPFRLLFFVLWLPFLLLKFAIGAIIGIAVGIPLLLVGLMVAAVALFAVVLMPLLPFAAVAFLIWLLVRASSRGVPAGPIHTA